MMALRKFEKMQHVLQCKWYFLKIEFLLRVLLFVVVMRSNGILILSFSLVFPAGEIQTALHISCSYVSYVGPSLPHIV